MAKNKIKYFEMSNSIVVIDPGNNHITAFHTPIRGESESDPSPGLDFTQECDGLFF